MVNTKSATMFTMFMYPLLSRSDAELTWLYKINNGQKISSIMVSTIDMRGKGHHGAFDAKFLTVVSKWNNLLTPDTTNIHNKQIMATIFAISTMVDMIFFFGICTENSKKRKNIIIQAREHNKQQTVHRPVESGLARVA